MSTWQERVVEELDDLKARAEQLAEFMETPEFEEQSSEHKSWLLIQSYGMAMYGEALQARLGE